MSISPITIVYGTHKTILILGFLSTNKHQFISTPIDAYPLSATLQSVALRCFLFAPPPVFGLEPLDASCDHKGWVQMGWGSARKWPLTVINGFKAAYSDIFYDI